MSSGGPGTAALAQPCVCHVLQSPRKPLPPGLFAGPTILHLVRSFNSHLLQIPEWDKESFIQPYDSPCSFMGAANIEENPSLPDSVVFRKPYNGVSASHVLAKLSQTPP